MDVENLTVRPLTPRIGSEIKADAETLLSGAHAKEIRAILEARGVLLFPRLGLTDEQQVAFGKTLGEIVNLGERGIIKISIDKKMNPNVAQAEYQKAAFLWHLDGTYDDVPALGALMTPRALSREGGDTAFANTYAAYEDLPEAEKREYAALRVVHNVTASQLRVNGWPTYEKLLEWRQFPSKTHPLVWTHRSGRKSLVLGTTASYILGMDPDESRLLLCRLCEWATQPNYVYTHKWTMGDLVIWDNTGTLHCATPYPEDSGRVMHRTTLVGEEPLV